MPQDPFKHGQPGDPITAHQWRAVLEILESVARGASAPDSLASLYGLAVAGKPGTEPGWWARASPYLGDAA